MLSMRLCKNGQPIVAFRSSTLACHIESAEKENDLPDFRRNGKRFVESVLAQQPVSGMISFAFQLGHATELHLVATCFLELVMRRPR